MVRDFAVVYLQAKDYNHYIHHIHRIHQKGNYLLLIRRVSLKAQLIGMGSSTRYLDIYIYYLYTENTRHTHSHTQRWYQYMISTYVVRILNIKHDYIHLMKEIEIQRANQIYKQNSKKDQIYDKFLILNVFSNAHKTDFLNLQIFVDTSVNPTMFQVIGNVNL